MTQVRAMAVFQGASALPDDQYVNTFHFVTPGADSGADQAACAAAVIDFYSTPDAIDGATVGSQLSPYIVRPYVVKTYDLADPKPREPTEFEGVLPNTGAASGLPEEVCVVLTLHGGPPLTPSRRGRLYIGPLNLNAIDHSGISAPTRWDIGLRNALRRKATELRDAGVGWSIYSPTKGLFAPIVGGYVDDAIDIQRRRGAEASTRSVWPIA